MSSFQDHSNCRITHDVSTPTGIRVLCESLMSHGTVRLNDSLFDSVHRGGRVEIIANDQGHRITPSWVSFTDDEHW